MKLKILAVSPPALLGVLPLLNLGPGGCEMCVCMCVCVCVSGYQGPLKNTCSHFWMMIWEQRTKAVIMLNRVMEKGSVR